MYGDQERFLYSDRIQFQAIIPLQNFIADLVEIDLRQGLKIRRITTSEIEELLDLRFSQLPYHEIIHVKYVAELVYSLKKLIGESTGSSDSQGAQAFSASWAFCR